MPGYITPPSPGTQAWHHEIIDRVDELARQAEAHRVREIRVRIMGFDYASSAWVPTEFVSSGGCEVDTVFDAYVAHHGLRIGDVRFMSLEMGEVPLGFTWNDLLGWHADRTILRAEPREMEGLEEEQYELSESL